MPAGEPQTDTSSNSGLKWIDMTISGRGPVVPTPGNVFGFAINQHDNDRSGRQASVQWSAKLADEVWFNPQLLGKVTFQANHKLKMEAGMRSSTRWSIPWQPCMRPMTCPGPC